MGCAMFEAKFANPFGSSSLSSLLAATQSKGETLPRPIRAKKKRKRELVAPVRIPAKQLSIEGIKIAYFERENSQVREPLFSLREFDSKILRHLALKLKGLEEDQIRAQITQAIVKRKIQTIPGTKAQLRTLKDSGVLGKRAPKCSMLSLDSLVQLVEAFDMSETARTLEKSWSQVKEKKEPERQEIVVERKPEPESQGFEVLRASLTNSDLRSSSKKPRKKKSSPSTAIAEVDLNTRLEFLDVLGIKMAYFEQKNLAFQLPEPLFSLREFDFKILRASPRLSVLQDEQQIRAQVTRAIAKGEIKTVPGTKQQLRLLKNEGILGKRAPKCCLLPLDAMVTLMGLFALPHWAKALQDSWKNHEHHAVKQLIAAHALGSEARPPALTIENDAVTREDTVTRAHCPESLSCALELSKLFHSPRA